jgi:hypothetical protein
MLLIKIGSIHFWLWLDLKGLKSVVIYYGIYLGFADKRKKENRPSFTIFYIEGNLSVVDFQGIDRGGILETTVDHSDIRGLAAA